VPILGFGLIVLSLKIAKSHYLPNEV
jgi:hypothetical protein